MMNIILWNVTPFMLTESYRTDMILFCITMLDDSGNGDDRYDDRYAGTSRISTSFVVKVKQSRYRPGVAQRVPGS